MSLAFTMPPRVGLASAAPQCSASLNQSGDGVKQNTSLPHSASYKLQVSSAEPHDERSRSCAFAWQTSSPHATRAAWTSARRIGIAKCVALSQVVVLKSKRSLCDQGTSVPLRDRDVPSARKCNAMKIPSGTVGYGETEQHSKLEAKCLPMLHHRFGLESTLKTRGQMSAR